MGHLVSWDSFDGGYSTYGYNARGTGTGLLYTITNGASVFPIFVGVNTSSLWLSWGREYSFSAASADWATGEAFKRYRYTITGDKDSGYSLVETEEYPILNATARVGCYGMDSRRVLPTANEFRPINIAVRYFIRGR